MNLQQLKRKFLALLDGEIHPNGQSSIYFKGFLTFVIYLVTGALVTIVFFAPLSLFFPIRILVKRQMSEKKVSFMVEELEGTLRQSISSEKKRKTILIAPYYSEFPNRQLATMYSKYFKLLTNRNRQVHRVMDYVWPIVRITRSKVNNSATNFYESWNSSGPLIRFSTVEARAGEKYLRELFSDNEKPYVAFCHGSKMYRQAVDIHDRGHVERPLSWVGLGSYKDAIEHLNCAGYNVARFGVLMDQEETNFNAPNFYDTCQSRSDFSDVYLNSKCSFILSGVSGGWWLGAPFNSPVVLTNAPYPIGSNGSSDIFIPCMPWLIGEESYASFLWQFENFEWAADTSKLGVEYEGVRNHSSQIVDLVSEMLKRLNGEWIDTDEDLELQARFKKLYDLLSPNLRTPAKIGAKFLREHQHLLPE